MFKQVFRMFSAWFIWRWFKSRWRSTLALVIFLALTAVIHDEYIEYVELTNEAAFLFASYLIKWIGIVIGVSLYVLLSVLQGTSMQTKENLNQKRKSPDATLASSSLDDEDDGFNFLREKGRLESRAEKLINGESKDG